MKRIHKAYNCGRLIKENVNCRGYNKFLEISKELHRGSYLLCFIAYKVYKELERFISMNRTGMSVDKVLDVAKTIVSVRVDMPQNGELYTRTLFLTKTINVSSRYSA